MIEAANGTPLRLRLDSAALVANWRWLDAMSGPARCGAAVKANGYGLGATDVVTRLAEVGCGDFFVATWDEALALGDLPAGCSVSVLHGVRDEDMAIARDHHARPVINTLAQLTRWRATGRPCDVMVDTGMNRLGLAVGDVLGGALDGVEIVTLMSHLACADEDMSVNDRQRDAFAALAGRTRAMTMSLANSAGICLGTDFAFGLTRPGLALYGGLPRREGHGNLQQVAYPAAQVLQVRLVERGDSVGYGGDWTAQQRTRVAILNFGYADGYRRAFANVGTCLQGRCPVLGRVSMDLLAIDVTEVEVGEGDWVDIDYDLPAAATNTGLSQYELLTGLGSRSHRSWF